jgi:hypothetical protein
LTLAKSYKVTTPAWNAIMQRMGLTGLVDWFLADTVVPVALVDTGVALNATTILPAFGTPFSAGELTGVFAANTRLVDTGQLAAGTYSVFAWMTVGEVTQALRMKRRNAADAADIWSQRFTWIQSQLGVVIVSFRLSLAANERLVIENVNAAGAGAVYQAAIFLAAG